MSKRSSIESKTIRPGLLEFSRYASDRHPAGKPQTTAKRSGWAWRRVLLGLIVLAAAIAAGYIYHTKAKPVATTVASSTAVVQQTKPAAKKAAAPAATAPSTVASNSSAANPCAGNVYSKFILVSISQRHMWACQQATQVYDSPVVTGMEMYAADLTPPGTYHIYEKETSVVLKGSDSTGSWSDPVSYWMPWLENQYGVYGFHDATWRPNSAFGNISPDSTDASHGCVELPLATAAWLYNWAPIGTTLTIQS